MSKFIDSDVLKQNLRNFDNLVVKKRIENTESSLNERIDSLDEVKHTHANKELLDSYTNSNDELTSAVDNTHAHSNKNVIDYLGQNDEGDLTYKGQTIKGDSEPETELIDFSDFEDYEQLVYDAEVEDETLVLGENSNLSTVDGGTITIDDEERTVEDSELRESIALLQDTLIEGHGISISEDGTISVSE